MCGCVSVWACECGAGDGTSRRVRLWVRVRVWVMNGLWEERSFRPRDGRRGEKERRREGEEERRRDGEEERWRGGEESHLIQPVLVVDVCAACASAVRRLVRVLDRTRARTATVDLGVGARGITTLPRGPPPRPPPRGRRRSERLKVNDPAAMTLFVAASRDEIVPTWGRRSELDLDLDLDLELDVELDLDLDLDLDVDLDVDLDSLWDDDDEEDPQDLDRDDLGPFSGTG